MQISTAGTTPLLGSWQEMMVTVHINPNIAARRTTIIRFPVPRKKQRIILQRERFLKEILSDAAGGRAAQRLAGGSGTSSPSRAAFCVLAEDLPGRAKPAHLLSCTAKDAPGASIANLCLSARTCTAGAFVVGSPRGCSWPTVTGDGC